MLSIEERNKLVEDNYYLVECIARTFCVSNGISLTEKEDLCQEGVIGLIDSIERYEKSEGIKLRTYCKYRIKGAMLDYLRRIDLVPRSIRRRIKKRKKAIERYIAAYCKEPTAFQMSEFLGISLEEYIIEYYSHQEPEIMSINVESDDNRISTFEESLSNDDINFAEDLCQKDFFEFLMRKLINISGSKRNKEIIKMYFIENKTMKEVGKSFGITDSRVSQIVEGLMNKFKKFYEEELENIEYAL